MSKIWTKKPMSAFENDMKSSQLKRVLGKWSLTAIGIGAIIGGGIFVLTGTGAYYHAGPALALSFIIAGIACVFAALCYSEFASILPVEGSAYAYAYGTVGEIFAWIIGWGLILEYAMGSMTVAVSWSGYFNKLLKMFGLHLPDYLTSDPASYTGEGTKEAAKANNLIVIMKVSAVLFVIIAGAFFINADNWNPFIPAATMVREGENMKEAYGIQGIISGAAAIFFAYVGFDAVSTQAGMMHYSDFNPQGKYPDAIKAPVAYAFEIAGQGWAGYIITIAATVGLISVLMVMIMGQSRIFLGMSKDGLIPKMFSDVHPVRKTPAKSLMLLGIIIATVAAFTPISKLADMTSFGTLFAFTMVCVAVWILRKKEPNMPRTFKVPALPVIATLGICINLYLIWNLSHEAKYLSMGWLALGVVIYFTYSLRNSKLHKVGYGETFKAEQEPLQKPDLD
ncbi:hypothetical protein Lal_00009628 [Lupinus albus]|nr:hypothetical protein Lal_00009628 [Lupinus albus]